MCRVLEDHRDCLSWRTGICGGHNSWLVMPRLRGATQTRQRYAYAFHGLHPEADFVTKGSGFKRVAWNSHQVGGLEHGDINGILMGCI